MVEESPRNRTIKNPTRTTKTTQKLVLFPFENEIELTSPINDVSPHYRVTGYCISDSIHIERLQACLNSSKRFDEVVYSPFFPEMISIIGRGNMFTPADHLESVYSGHVFFFDYGVVVIWGLSEKSELEVCKALIGFCSEILDDEHVQYDSLYYKQLDDEQQHGGIFNDVISLRKSSNVQTLLTLSHAIAQSVKLSLFEVYVSDTINLTEKIPKQLAEEGRVLISSDKITTLIAELFTTRMNVNLISNVLDTPDLFWNEPQLEKLYASARVYLEITQRVNVLNQRVGVISDLLDVLRDHSTHQHANSLEWIVIFLIFICIVIGCIEVVIFQMKK